LGLICVLAVLGIAAPSATALVAKRHETRLASFTGTDCGSMDSFGDRLPKGAFDVRITRPTLGSALPDFDSGQIVARVTKATVDRDTAWPIFRVSVTGSDDACSRPEYYAENGYWSTDDIAIRVDYKTRERVYGPAGCEDERIRPSTIVIACGDGNFFIKGIRWQRWRDHLAKGRGTAYANDCIPFCAAGHFHKYRIRLALSRPRWCATTERFKFARLDLRYPGAYPGGARAYHLGFRC
jgi:hypothetical protein